MSETCIVIPIYKQNIEKVEEIALAQCFKIFQRYPIIFVAPKSLNTSKYAAVLEKIGLTPGIRFIYFPEKFFRDIHGYNRLLLSPSFYGAFRKFEFILIYQLDAFVFRDELVSWIKKGYDYIGAPWQQGWGQADESSKFIGVGNGGFSLRNVRKCQKVLNSFSYVKKPKTLLKEWHRRRPVDKIRSFSKLISDLTIKNNTHKFFNDFNGHEDFFWGNIASRNFPWFKTSPIEEAISFSFEVNPQKLFQLNNNQLPFGCHAWWKYAPEFWKPYIEQEGYSFS